MFDAIIELNDIDLPVLHAGQMHSVPAFALLQKDGLLFGAAARDKARLYPLKVNNRFLQQLSMVETPELHPYARHQADLAFRFLNYMHGVVGEPGRSVFVVPSNFTEEQLGVLLGVVAQCPFDAVGLVDQAVAAAASESRQSHGVFCDVQLHQLLVCEYSRENDQIVRGASRTDNQLGLLALYDRWVRIVADAFVQQCRFDPLHDATVEQQLWAELPQLLAANADSDVLEYGLLNKHQVRIPRAELQAPVIDFFAGLERVVTSLAPAASEWLWTSRLASIPGLDQSDSRIKVLRADAFSQPVSMGQKLICVDSANLPFITSLPAFGPATDSAPGTTATAPDVRAASSDLNASNLRASADAIKNPTHFVLDGTATALGAESLYLNSMGDGIVWTRQPGSLASVQISVGESGWRLESLTSEPVWHNNEVLSEPVLLHKGDQVRLSPAGAAVLFIEVAA